MGLRTFCPDRDAPVPRAVHLELKCDGANHGLLPPEPTVFTHDCFLQQLSAAMRAGWKETFDAAGEKRWLGPCCSGKKARG